MKKGAILAVSLGFIALLTSIIYLFVEINTKTKDSQNAQYSTIQISSLFGNLSDYIKNIEVDNEMLFYSSKIPLPIEIGDIDLTLYIKSANNKISLNRVLRKILEKKDNQKSYDKLFDFLRDNQLNNPNFFIDLLLDSVDKDDEERSYDSEIVNFNQSFYNGAIASYAHLLEVIDYYAITQNDIKAYDIKWNELFHFYEHSDVDINHASYLVLKFLLPDASESTLRKIVQRNEWYEKVEDLPFDSEYKKKVLGEHFGVTLAIKSSVLNIKFDVISNIFNGNFSFYKTMEKKSKVYNIQVETKKELED